MFGFFFTLSQNSVVLKVSIAIIGFGKRVIIGGVTWKLKLKRKERW
jgi:hypothetical protein